MKSGIAPSMMCADFGDLLGTLKTLERNGIEYLHVDIMDGSFVPNFTLGTDFCKFLKRNSNIPLDFHLMIEEPERKLDWFPIEEGDLVSIHYEATKHLQRAIDLIHKKGAKALVALNPGTPIGVLEDVMEDIEGVLIMTVNPGFAGQKLVGYTLLKIRKLRQFLDVNGNEDLFIEVDGNVTPGNAFLMREMGADLFVAGTSSIFKAGEDMDKNIEELRLHIR